MRALCAALAAIVATSCGGPSSAERSGISSPSTSAAASASASSGPLQLRLQEFPVPRGQGPHDVAPALDGGVWYTAQRSGELGWLDPKTGATRAVKLGQGSAPHGVIVGPDGAPWVTDGGLNAIVRVDPRTNAVKRFPLPADRANANLNTATFDHRGILWFTGQSGVYGRLDPATGEMRIFGAPRGAGPYGIASARSGDVYYASLAGSYVGRIDVASDTVRVLQPPTPGQGARRVWSDSQGRIWVSEWNAGKLALYNPTSDAWREYGLGNGRVQAYAVYVDDRDIVWVTDFGNNALLRFEPETATVISLSFGAADAAVRQLLGRPGEIWGAESAQDKLVLVRTAP